jgi:hypothetical protein
MHPGSRFAREETRAECDAADEAYHQQQAALMGDACFDLAETLAMELDRYPSRWKADDLDKLAALHGALAAALHMAQEIKP